MTYGKSVFLKIRLVAEALQDHNPMLWMICKEYSLQLDGLLEARDFVVIIVSKAGCYFCHGETFGGRFS
jgi:hypothetical protein